MPYTKPTRFHVLRFRALGAAIEKAGDVRTYEVRRWLGELNKMLHGRLS